MLCFGVFGNYEMIYAFRELHGWERKGFEDSWNSKEITGAAQARTANRGRGSGDVFGEKSKSSSKIMLAMTREAMQISSGVQLAAQPWEEDYNTANSHQNEELLR